MCNHKWMTFGVDANGNYRICSKCGKKVYIITNADRIRAMDDKELAKFLMECNPANCQQCAFSSGWRCAPDREDYSDFGKCMEGRKRWLQQPAEEENR